MAAAAAAAAVQIPARWLPIVESAAHASGTAEFWDFEQNQSQGLIVNIVVSVLTAGASLVFKIQGVDPATGAVWDILASSAVTATGTTRLTVHPALTAAANSIAKDALPSRIRILATPADSKSVTYVIGATLVA